MARKTTRIDISNPRSYSSIIYGALTVVIIFLILFFGIRAISQRQATITPQAQDTTAGEYIVKEGDTLWSIAQDEYNDGYKWTEIAKANNLSSPDQIEKGMKLNLPDLSKMAQASPTGELSVTPAPTVAMTTEQVDAKITGESYKIVEGDNLWDICVRAYGDGYKWSEVAKVNKIPNPDLIYPGDELNLPR